MEQLISIHAPTRGATCAAMSEQIEIYISIHAPTRGATYTNISVIIMSSHFNPRSHERSDVKALRLLQWQLFQSTLPREERQVLRRNRPPMGNFNPRSHERSDTGAG